MKGFEKTDKYFDSISKITHYCECGHSVQIPEYVNKTICTWCGKTVFKNELAKFKYRLNSELKKV